MEKLIEHLQNILDLGQNRIDITLVLSLAKFYNKENKQEIMKGKVFRLNSPISKENGRKLREQMEKSHKRLNNLIEDYYINCTDMFGENIKVRIR